MVGPADGQNMYKGLLEAEDVTEAGAGSRKGKSKKKKKVSRLSSKFPSRCVG